MTTQDRFHTAIRNIRAEGVAIRQNLRKCCRGCVEESDLGLTPNSAAPYGYIFGGQSQAITWVDGEPYNAAVYKRAQREYPVRARRESDVYFNHGNGAGEVIANAFRAQGFEVDWNGSDSECVIVKF